MDADLSSPAIVPGVDENAQHLMEMVQQATCLIQEAALMPLVEHAMSKVADTIIEMMADKFVNQASTPLSLSEDEGEEKMLDEVSHQQKGCVKTLNLSPQKFGNAFESMKMLKHRLYGLRSWDDSFMGGSMASDKGRSSLQAFSHSLDY